MADLLGLKAAYLAYRHFLRRTNDTDETSSKSTVTRKQMFWITMVAPLCSIYSDSAMKAREDFANRNLPAFRSKILANFKEFRDDFACCPETLVDVPNLCTYT